jgi:hypothetical protein
MMSKPDTRQASWMVARMLIRWKRVLKAAIVAMPKGNKKTGVSCDGPV